MKVKLNESYEVEVVDDYAKTVRKNNRVACYQVNCKESEIKCEECIMNVELNIELEKVLVK